MEIAKSFFSFVMSPQQWELKSKHYMLRAMTLTIFTATLVAVTALGLARLGTTPLHILKGVLALVAIGASLWVSITISRKVGGEIAELATRKKRAETAKSEAEADTAYWTASEARSKGELAQRELAVDKNAELLLILVKNTWGLFVLKGTIFPAYDRLVAKFENRDGRMVALTADEFVSYLKATISAQERMPEEVSWFQKATMYSQQSSYVTCRREEV